MGSGYTAAHFLQQIFFSKRAFCKQPYTQSILAAYNLCLTKKLSLVTRIRKSIIGSHFSS